MIVLSLTLTDDEHKILRAMHRGHDISANDALSLVAALNRAYCDYTLTHRPSKPVNPSFPPKGQ